MGWANILSADEHGNPVLICTTDMGQEETTVFKVDGLPTDQQRDYWNRVERLATAERIVIRAGKKRDAAAAIKRLLTEERGEK